MELPARVGVAHSQQQQLGIAGAHDAGRPQRAVGRDLGRRRQAGRRHVDAAHGEAHVVVHQCGERRGGGGVGQQGGQRRRGQRGRLQQRLGESRPARLLQHAHQVDVAQAQPVGRLGHDEGRCAQLGQHGPAVLRLLGPGRLVGHVEGAQGIRGALGVEDDAHACTQCLLFLGEREIHGLPVRPFAAQPRGSPSRRSATTLR